MKAVSRERFSLGSSISSVPASWTNPDENAYSGFRTCNVRDGSPVKILVLGGAGAMARATVRDLLTAKDVDAVGVADLSLEGAKAFVAGFRSDRAKALHIDVRDGESLRRLVKQWDVVVNETWYELNLDVMSAAIAAGVHYVDLGGLYHMTLKQLTRHRAAADAGVTCLLGMGATPGTMNLMASYGASRLDRIERVRLASGSVTVSGESSEGFVVPYSIRTILDEVSFPAPVFRNGRIEFVPPLTEKEVFQFPEPVGRVEGYRTIHSELATLPEHLGKGLKEMDFTIVFPPDLASALATLARLGLVSRDPLRIGEREVIPYHVVAAAVDRLPKPKGPTLDVDMQRCEITGIRRGERVVVTYDSIAKPNLKWQIDGGTVSTGTPASIAAQWIARGKITARGVVPPEVAVEPLAFFRELGAKGRTIEVWERDTEERLLSGNR